MGKTIEMTGKRFGRLTVIRKDEIPGAKRQAFWICLCDCGNEKRVDGQKLRNGNTKSCGCFSSEDRATRGVVHGHAAGGKASRTYISWAGMIQRCTNKNRTGYESWGGRGISVCERWMVFDNFVADMGERPSGMSIDRINQNGDYEPANCRWATHKQQQNNRRNNKLLTAFGKTQTLATWIEELGLNLATVQRRLRRGMSHDQALYPGNYCDNP